MSSAFLNKVLKVALAASLACSASPALAAMTGLPEKTAAAMIELDPSTTTTVYKHGVCRKVTNTNPLSILIPLSNAAEWSGSSGFIPNLADMTGVSVSKCASSGYDLVFCYYTNTTGGYGRNCGPVTIGLNNPRLMYTAGVFDSSTETLEAIMAIAGDHMCKDNVEGDLLHPRYPPYGGMQEAYDNMKDDIYWPPGVDWCLIPSQTWVTDMSMEGGNSGSGYTVTEFIMRVWNPAAN